MSDPRKTTLTLAIDPMADYFPPEIVILDDDPAERAMFFPWFPLAQQEDVDEELKDAVWQLWDEDNPMADDPDFTESNGLAANGFQHIDLDADKGQDAFRSSPELTIARLGRQRVRVYGRFDEDDLCTAYAVTMFGPVCLAGKVNSDENKMIVYHSLVKDTKEADETDYTLIKLKDTRDAGYFDTAGSNLGRFVVKTPDDQAEGRYLQLKAKEKNHLAYYYFRFIFGDVEFKRAYVVSANRARHLNEVQVKRLGKRWHTYREVLTFRGDKTKDIKYWYDDSVVKVISWTQFYNRKLEKLDYRPHNESMGSAWWDADWTTRISEKDGYRPCKGRTFRAKEEVWGSLLVEYKVSYLAYDVLYDFPKTRREFQVLPGSVERVGTLKLDYKDDVVERTSKVNGQDIGWDRLETDKEWIRANKKKSDFNIAKAPQTYLKLMHKVSLLPFKVTPLEIYFTDGKTIATTTFRPPEPSFMELVEEEMPRMLIFTEAKRYRVYNAGARTNDAPYSEYERIIEATFVDPLGRITKERYERGDDGKEDSTPVKVA